jgi:twitching motility two-component system response regulator PilG
VNEPVVLVVDDSPTVRAIVVRILQHQQLQVVTAADGLSALAAVADTHPDLILLDIMLPRMDGYEICHMLRQHREFHETPILMLSGKDGMFDRLRGRMAGATAYISKPFDPEELASMVKRYVRAPAMWG